MNAYYAGFQEYYKNKINSLVSTFDIELVLYDETEYFRGHTDLQFNYPFTTRKTKLQTFKFSISETADHYFHSTSIKFRRSSACLEGSFMDQMGFFTTLYHVGYDIID
jgi:hypothetical protein